MTPDAAELDRRARALLRPEVYHYYAAGSGRETTLRSNQEALAACLAAAQDLP
jgi:isopentenyl diphosphate isomerase/L-lactate dehydrogenase-like FMN-dependent dehydrogenase